MRQELTGRAGYDDPSLAALAAELRDLMAANPDFRTWYPTYQRLFGPFEDVPRRLRTGDVSAIEAALRFLEADPWCFRSGYLKESLMRSLASGVDLTGYRSRIQRILLKRLHSPEPGLRKPSMTLAASIWDADLDHLLEELMQDRDPGVRDRALDLRVGVERRRSGS